MANYFKDTNVNDWCLRNAYNSLERDKPNLSTRQLLSTMKEDLQKFLETDSVNTEKAAAAVKILQQWRKLKTTCLEQKNDSITVENYGVVNIFQNDNIPTKRAHSDLNSAVWSWNSNNKTNKSKHLKVYLSDYYDQTDFGESDDEERWTVHNINMTFFLKRFRDKNIQGTLMRKSLSDERTLSLSYVFFISHKSRLLSQFNTSEKSAIMNNLNITKGLNSIEETTVLTCFHVLKILQDKKVVNEQDANDEMDKLRTTCVIQQSKTATRIVSSLLYKYFSSVQKDSESNLTIETLRPFIKHIIVSTCADIKLEWMSYRMSSGTNDGQMMIPDLALYIDPLSVINFELFIVEVKKHGNFSNGTLENDMIKLGKEMKLAVDKLITHKVDSPEIIGLLIRGLNVTVMKMDLQYNGQYRLIEISTFFLVRDTIDDIMLIPSIIQKLDQVRQIIQDTMEKIYKAIRKELCSTRVNNTFMRKGCHSPVTVKKE